MGDDRDGTDVPRTMGAVVHVAAGPDRVEWREVPVPDIGPADVLLRVRAVGVCGSDVHQWRGSHSWPVRYPCTLGHEFSGVVVRTGRDVRLFQEGDRVTSETAAVVDPDSTLTRQGRYHLDPSRLGFGYGVDGAMASYVRVPERCLHHVPDELTFEQAALTEPCCVAYHAVCVQTRMRPGDHVLVLGPGPIGLLCGVMARLSGACVVLVAGLESDVHRLRVAERLELSPVLASDAVEAVRSMGDGLGADVVVDAAGASAALSTAVEAVRPGGWITKVGWGREPMEQSLDPLVQKAVTLQGSFSHVWEIWERVLRLLAHGRIEVNAIVDRVAPLSDWGRCLRAHACMRICKGRSRAVTVARVICMRDGRIFPIFLLIPGHVVQCATPRYDAVCSCGVMSRCGACRCNCAMDGRLGGPEGEWHVE